MLRPALRMQGIERTLIRQIFDAAPADAINLGLGQPDLPTPARIRLAGIRGIAEGRTAYTSTAGDGALRAAVARRYEGFVGGPEGVVITIGSQEAMFAALLTLADPGDEVLYPDPGYPAYATMIRLVGARPVAYPLRYGRGFRIDPADVEACIGERTRLIIHCNPSNPTGAVERPEDLERLARLLESRGVGWISDEIYSAFVYDAPYSSLRDHSRSGGLVVSSVSKDLSMTGWRVGWVAGPAPIVARIIAAHQYLVTCAPSVSQTAALAAMDPQGDAERVEHLEIFRRRRETMARELSRLPHVRFHLPGGAFYFFVDVSAHGPSLPLAQRILERRKVVTIPGVAFGAGGEGFLRLSYAAREEDIVAGVRAVAQELAAGSD